MSAIKCRDCLSYHARSQSYGYCAYWKAAAKEDQGCKEGKEKPNGIKMDPDQ